MRPTTPNGGRRNRLLSAAVLCRVSRYAMACEPCRVHSLFGGVCDEEGDRSHQGQASQGQGFVEARDGRRALPGAERRRSRGQDRGRSLQVGTRSPAGHERRSIDGPGLRQAQTGQPADLAHPPERRRCSSGLRVTKITYYIRPSCIRSRSPDCKVSLEVPLAR